MVDTTTADMVIMAVVIMEVIMEVIMGVIMAVIMEVIMVDITEVWRTNKDIFAIKIDTSFIETNAAIPSSRRMQVVKTEDFFLVNFFLS